MSEKESNFLAAAIQLAQEARKAADTKHWINGTWVSVNHSALKNLHDQLSGIQLLLVRSGAGDSHACSEVNSQLRYIGEKLEKLST